MKTRPCPGPRNGVGLRASLAAEKWPWAQGTARRPNGLSRARETRPEAVRRTAPAGQKRPSSCQAAFNLQEKQVFFFFKEPTYDFLRG